MQSKFIPDGSGTRRRSHVAWGSDLFFIYWFRQSFVIQDDLTRLTEILVEFWKRNDREVVGMKKVGDLWNLEQS